MTRRTPANLRVFIVGVRRGERVSDAYLRDQLVHAQQLDRIVGRLRGVVTAMVHTLGCTRDEAMDLLTPMVRDADELGYEKRAILAVEEHFGRDVLARVRPASRTMEPRRARTPLERDALRKRVHRAKKARVTRR